MADRFQDDRSYEHSNTYQDESQPSDAYHNQQEYNRQLYANVNQHYVNHATNNHSLISHSTNEQSGNNQPSRPLAQFVAGGQINPTSHIYQQMMMNSQNVSSNQVDYHSHNYGYQSFNQSVSPALQENQANHVSSYQESYLRDNSNSYLVNQLLDQSINHNLSNSLARLGGHLSVDGTQQLAHPINGYNAMPHDLISSFPVMTAPEQMFPLQAYNMSAQPMLRDELQISSSPRQYLVPVLPIKIERIQRATNAPSQAVGKLAPVNIAQRMQGTIEVPAWIPRGQGRLLLRINCHRAVPQSIPRQGRADPANRLHDIRPEFDYTFREMTGFGHLGDDYWNGRINPDRYGIVECEIDMVCKQIMFTGSIVKRDASWNVANPFTSTTLRVEWLSGGGSRNAPECICAWEQMVELHRRV